jgi:hypothetical protein
MEVSQRWSLRVLRRRLGRLPFWLSICALILAGQMGVASRPSAAWPPPTLQDTELYSNWSTKTVAAGNLPFSPQYPLWSDGALKSRWLRLPPGGVIDASNPDVWRFPIGTRLWKEFRFGRRAETRFIEYTTAGWQFASYVWNDDETAAPLAPEFGVRQSVPIRDGVRHAIPSRQDCRACHEAGPVRVLGASTLQLSPDRDPSAPHAEALPSGAVDLAELVARGLVQGLPGYLTTAPRIVASTATSRAVLGYLHANCGSCHTGAGEMASLAFALNYTFEARGAASPPALLTAAGKPSLFRVSTLPEVIERVRPGHPEASMLVTRMASRNPAIQMPPLGTRLVDEEALALVRRWIAEDLTGASAPTASR